MSSKLKDLAYGRASQLVLRGPVPSGVPENLRLLDRLDLLTDDMVWQIIGHAAIDPLFLIRIIRDHRTALGLEVPERHNGRTLVFRTLDTQMLLAVDVLTNDCVFTAVNDKVPKVTGALMGDTIYEELEKIPVGNERLARLLDILKMELAKR